MRNSLARNDLVYNGREAIQNEGMMHVRYRDRDTRKASPEGLFQYQWNGAWGMISRTLIGGNLRLRFMEERKADLYMALGAFREWEAWDWSGVKGSPPPSGNPISRRSLFRLNQYLKYAIRLNDAVDLSAASFLQLPLSGRFLQARWNLDANLYLHVARRMSVVVHWDHIFDRNRIVPIDDFYYSFSTGLQYAW